VAAAVATTVPEMAETGATAGSDAATVNAATAGADAAAAYAATAGPDVIVVDATTTGMAEL
jgi:CheY-like chemotaxis protein